MLLSLGLWMQAPAPEGTTGPVRWEPGTWSLKEGGGLEAGEEGSLMTFRPHPLPAWAVLVASGCLSPSFPR